jgi:DDE family transposase
LRIAEVRKKRPTAAVIDSRTLQATPESGGRAGYDGAKRRKGSKVHLAVDRAKFRLDVTLSPLGKGYERLPETLAGLHYVAFVILTLKNAVEILT